MGVSLWNVFASPILHFVFFLCVIHSIDNSGTCRIAYQSQLIGENFAFITLRYVRVIELSLSRLVAKIGDTFISILLK